MWNNHEKDDEYVDFEFGVANQAIPAYTSVSKNYIFL